VTLAAGRLRHRITIQRPINTQDSSGNTVLDWEDVATDVPAEIVLPSVRERVAAQQMQSEASGRITIRYRPGMSATMRLIGLSGPYDGMIFNPEGWSPDPDSGLEYLTAPCSTGANETGA
jgi:SPP1 family predicted phage head-tail adaptor